MDLSPAIEAKENLFFGNANNPPLNFGKIENSPLFFFYFLFFFLETEIETKSSNNNNTNGSKVCRLCSMSRKKFICKKCLQQGVFSSNSSEERYIIKMNYYINLYLHVIF